MTLFMHIYIYQIIRINFQAEQNAIRISNEQGNQPLSWAQTRNMPITYKVHMHEPSPIKYSIVFCIACNNIFFLLPCYSQVVLESLRMASIISFVFREATVDVEYKGNP